MKIGLVDVDGHHFPNLALMRIASYWKANGANVDWWWTDMEHYDTVYMSKVFGSVYSADAAEPMNADKVIRGGTGYCIDLVDGREVFDCSKNVELPPEIEAMPPDYSIYPQYNYAVAMTSRGCPRGCGFCHVAAKEGRKSHKVADVDLFYRGQKEIKVLDPNITACADKEDLFQQYVDTKAYIDFTQGLDIRLLTGADVDLLNQMKIKEVHFAWDNPEDDLKGTFEDYAEAAKHRPHGRYAAVYCLTNFNSTLEQDLYRVLTLRDLGYDPYVMIYNKPTAPKKLRYLQRWCNNRYIFRACTFEEYMEGREL